MLKLNKIHNNRGFYKLSRLTVGLFHNIFYYRKVTYTGRENITENKPTLIGPNHQNALMDAMAILSSRIKKYIAFLARSDIFNNDNLGNFFIAIKILPVYRIRDGKEKLAKNEEIFNIAVEVLEKNRDLVIFPEAQHTSYRSLLQLKKGLMRVAFHIAEKHDFNIDLQIIPTGIYYENYYKYRSKLLVNFGKPISIKKYKNLYKQKKQSALIALKKDMREAMIPLAIHIKNKEFYNQYEASREIFDYQTAKNLNLNLKKQVDKFKTDKKIIDKLDNAFENDRTKFDKLISKIENYSQILKNEKLKDYLLDKPVSLFKTFILTLIWILLLPIKIFSFVNFAVPLCLPELLVRKFKDAQFHSSVRFVASFFFPMIWGLIGFALLWILTGIWWIALIFFLFQHPLMAIWFELRKLYKKIIGRWRYFFKSNTRKRLKQKREEIISIYKTFES